MGPTLRSHTAGCRESQSLADAPAACFDRCAEGDRGWVKTSVTEARHGRDRAGVPIEEARARLAHHTPLQRMAEPEELASVCLFLASSEASFVTRAIVIADGGAHVVDVGTLAFE